MKRIFTGVVCAISLLSTTAASASVSPQSIELGNAAFAKASGVGTTPQTVTESLECYVYWYVWDGVVLRDLSAETIAALDPRLQRSAAQAQMSALEAQAEAVLRENSYYNKNEILARYVPEAQQAVLGWAGQGDQTAVFDMLASCQIA